MASKRNWVAFFSQTGSEILEVSKKLHKFPDLIIFNSLGICAAKNEYAKINPELIKHCYNELSMFPIKPTEEDYDNTLLEDDLITLHGWLNIIPSRICNQHEIYNGHPGLITKYPELKGRDPQIKAFNKGLKESGCVIHKVTAGVDEGEILQSITVNIEDLGGADLVIEKLHKASVDLWVKFLRKKLK